MAAGILVHKFGEKYPDFREHGLAGDP